MLAGKLARPHRNGPASATSASSIPFFLIAVVLVAGVGVQT
jgi:hypothetical protein